MGALKIIEAGSAGYAADVAELLRVLRSGGLVDVAQQQQALDVPAIVADIIARVRSEGDVAAAQLTSKLDRAQIEPSAIAVPESEIARAHRAADPAFLAL